MRLIDANDIEYFTEKVGCGKFDYTRRYLIDAMPTVDAIPIEYMQSQVDCGKWEEIIQRWREHEINKR